MWWIYFVLILLIGPLTFHVSTRYNRRGRILQKIPGPFAWPIFGNLLTFNVNCLHKFWEIGRRITKAYYPITRFWICKSAVVSVLHPDDLEILFSNPKFIDKGYIYEYLHPWLKTGLLTSTGDKWRKRRKILTPAFHFSILKKYLEIASEEGKKFIDELKTEGDEIVRSLMPFCSKCTLNIICESAMGVHLDTMDGKLVEKYKKAVHNMGNVVLYRMPRPYITNWMMRYVWKWGAIQRKAVKTLHRFTEELIKDRMEYHRQTGNEYLKEFIKDFKATGVEDLDSHRKKRLAMLDLLLAAEQNGLIDYEGIKEEVDTFTFEAHDTTGMAMTFSLMLLAENEEAQKLARAEVTEILDGSGSGGVIGVKELQELNYLDRCIKESLRLYPPVATLVRYTPEDLQLKHALVPADSHIMIHMYDTHRDPNFWPNPDKFDPDRFLPENSVNRHPYAYIPFSAGSRNCIGQKFAMMELKSLIARILYDFYLQPVDRTSDMRLMADIVLRPLDPVRIKLIRINK